MPSRPPVWVYGINDHRDIPAELPFELETETARIHVFRTALFSEFGRLSKKRVPLQLNDHVKSFLQAFCVPSRNLNLLPCLSEVLNLSMFFRNLQSQTAFLVRTFHVMFRSQRFESTGYLGADFRQLCSLVRKQSDGHRREHIQQPSSKETQLREWNT